MNVELAVVSPVRLPDGPLEEPELAHFNSQFAFQAPSEVKLFSPVRLKTFVPSSHDQPSLSDWPFRVTFETCPWTPSTVMLASGFESV